MMRTKIETFFICLSVLHPSPMVGGCLFSRARENLVTRGHLNFILLLERNLLIIRSLRVVVLLKMDPSLPLRPQMANKVKSVLIVMNHIILIQTLAIRPKNYGLLPDTFVWRVILFHILFAFVLVLNFNFDCFPVHF